jgi:hypothetical protein
MRLLGLVVIGVPPGQSWLMSADQPSRHAKRIIGELRHPTHGRSTAFLDPEQRGTAFRVHERAHDLEGRFIAWGGSMSGAFTPSMIRRVGDPDVCRVAGDPVAPPVDDAEPRGVGLAIWMAIPQAPVADHLLTRRHDVTTEQFTSFPLPSNPGDVRQILGRPGEVQLPTSSSS